MLPTFTSKMIFLFNCWRGMGRACQIVDSKNRMMAIKWWSNNREGVGAQWLMCNDRCQSKMFYHNVISQQIK